MNSYPHVYNFMTAIIDRGAKYILYYVCTTSEMICHACACQIYCKNGVDMTTSSKIAAPNFLIALGMALMLICSIGFAIITVQMGQHPEDYFELSKQQFLWAAGFFGSLFVFVLGGLAWKIKMGGRPLEYQKWRVLAHPLTLSGVRTEVKNHSLIPMNLKS